LITKIIRKAWIIEDNAFDSALIKKINKYYNSKQSSLKQRINELLNWGYPILLWDGKSLEIIATRMKHTYDLIFENKDKIN